MSTAPEYEVVISGISGKFPECHNVEEFKDKLFAKENLLRSDTDRWNPAQEDKPFISGKLPNSNKFDANFFGVHSKLVRNCDPLMGLMLERSFEAMMDAGVNPFSLRGRNVSVISATSLSDAEILSHTEGVFLEGFGMIGHSRTMMANRLSYYFNFTGPSYNFDSSWTSALQSLEIAAQQVAQGAVESAIVISANLLYYYSIDVEYRDLQLLSPDGKSSPFDNKASGFARSEGAMAFYIQRAQDAQRNYGSIVRAQSSYMGDRSCGYINLYSQIDRFLADFYRECKIDPSCVAYIETGGFCNKEFDAVELNAIEQVFCKNKTSPMPIGCVKGNIGNTEAPSGLVALAKLIIAMESGVIPPTINYNNPNSQVPGLASGQLKPVTETTTLSGDLLTLNLLDCYGTMSHILVKRNEKSKKIPSTVHLPLDSLPRLVLLQARHEEGANAITEKLNSAPLDTEFISLVNNAFKTPIPPYLWRTYTILPSSGKSAQNTQVFDPIKRPIWFVFSGMGSQWTEMGWELLQLPVFEAAVNKCDEVLRPRGIDIKHILTSKNDSIFDNVLNCFVGIAAVQMGLVDILRTLGITHDGMIGHSVGELGCAYADGCLTAQEMILAAYSRGKASLEAKKEDIGGMMAAVGMGYDEIKDRLPERIDVACHNAADSCTLSGPTEDVLRYVEQLNQEGVFAKAVSAGGVAYHSRYIKSVAPKLLQYLQEVLPNPKPRSSNWISSSVPQSHWDTENAKMCSAEYHTNNLLSPVLFMEACHHLPKNAIVIEIAPHGLLQAILRRSLGSDVVNVPLTSRGAQSNLSYLLNSLGQLYLNNVDMDINALYPTVSYPVSRSTPSVASLITWDHTEVCYKEFASRVDMLLKRGSTMKEFEINSKVEGYQLWQDHCIDNNVVLPITQLLMYPWKMILSYKRCNDDSTCVVIEDVSIMDQMVVDESEQSMMVTFSPVTSVFEVSPNSSLPDFQVGSRSLMKGKFYNSVIPMPTDSVQKISEICSDMEEVTTEEVYSLLAQFGLNLGPQFQAIKRVFIGETGCFAKVQWTGNVVTFLDALINIVVFLETDKQQCLYRPTYFNKLIVNMPILSALAMDAILDVEYNYLCNTLNCEGVQMHGITLGPVSQKKISNLIWNEMKFQPYFENSPTLDEFLSSTFQLVADNSFSPWTEKVKILNILELKEGNSRPVFSELLKYTNQSSFTIKITEVDVTNEKEQLEVDIRQFQLVFGDLSAVAVPSVQNIAYFLVYMSKNEFNISSNNSYPKPIFMCHSEAGVLVLLKKASPQTRLDVFEIDTASWLKELCQHISKRNNDIPLIIVSRKLSPRVVLPVLALEDQVKFLLDTDKIRTVFILDQDAPRFSSSSKLYSNQLALGLPVNILSRGEWGSLANFSANITSNHSKFEYLMTSPKDGLEISCISPNISTFTLKRDVVPNEQEMNYVDYSGKVGAKREMGIAQFESETNKLIADAILKWPVPAEWTMVDAATVPVTYSLAYYCLHLKAKVEKGERVLVHAGLSPLGQAMIAITLHIGGIIFTSVESEVDVPILLKIFPTLNPSHILVLGKDKIDVTIRKLTAGEGVQVIVNCLRGKYMQDSVKAMGFDCRFFHLGQIRIEDKESIGLLVFLKRTSFYGVSLDNIANCTDAWKTNIQEALQIGIEQGIVKPFRRSEFLFQHETEALANVSKRGSTEKTVLVYKHKLQLKSKRMLKLTPNNQIILAGEKGEWLEVAEWLSIRGACKFVLLTNDHLRGSEVRRFNKLINRQKTSVIMSSFTSVESQEDVEKLYKNIVAFGQISHIFCINMDENSNVVKNLDLASRQVLPDLQQFVTLLGEGSEVSGSRASAGLPVCSVKSNSHHQSCTQLLPYLSTVLADNGPSARFFTVCDKINKINVQGSEEIQAFLPVSFNNLHLMGLQVTKNHGFTEAVTLSPGYKHVRYSLLPLFVVPGLGSQSCQPLLQQLIHPAFCSSLTANFESVEKCTEILLKDLQKIQSQGPYNLVGVSWSSAVVIALGCKLEAQGHEVELYLIDGTPSSAKERIRNLCDRFAGDLGTSLLSTVLCLPHEVTKNISQLLSWEKKLLEGLRQVPADHYEPISKALTSLYNQLTAVQQSQRPTQVFKGKVTLISCKEPSSADLNMFSEFCSGSPSIVVTGDQTQSELLANAKTASVINKNINFSWKL